MPKKSQGDDVIVRGIYTGDENSIALLVAKYRNFLLRVEEVRWLSHEDAEEVVYDTLLAAIDTARAGALGPNIRSWIRKGAKWRAISKHRENQMFEKHEREALSQLGLPEAVTGADERKADTLTSVDAFLIGRARMRLTRKEQVMVDHAAERVPHEEIAKFEGISVNNARQLRHRALKRLKEEFWQLKRQRRKRVR